MAALSDEELESLLCNFDRVCQEYKGGISTIQMLRSSYDAEIKRRQALDITCSSLRTDNARLTKMKTESLIKLADQLDLRSKFRQLKEEMRKLQDERLAEEAEHRKAIEMLKQDHEVKIADLEEQIRCLLLQKQASEVTINQLQLDMAACKMGMDVLNSSLQQVKIDEELKYYNEIQDLKDLLSVEQEEKNELMKKLKIAEKELITCKTKQPEQQQELTSNRHVETLKQKIMKLRKENELLKRQFTCSRCLSSS